MIFEFYRLWDKRRWNRQRQWSVLLHVCRKWRYTILESAFHLKIRLFCDGTTPVAKMLMHFPPLPLVVTFDLASSHRKNVLFALQHHDRVNTISVGKWNLRDMEMFVALDKAFPALDALVLSSQDYANQLLPSNFMAPRLRSLHLQTVGVSAVSSLLTKAANLVSLTIGHATLYDGISPEYLVEHLSSLPKLESLCISTCFPREDLGGLQRTQIARVVLPYLWKLNYAGVDVYLENLLSLISAPSLQYFSVTFLERCTSTLLHLSEFLCSIKNLDFGRAKVSFCSLASYITYYPAQHSASLPHFSFNTSDRCEALLVTSTIQICSATAPILLPIQSLALMATNEPILNPHWQALLRSFGGVRTLLINVALTDRLCNALRPDNGVATKGLLPSLSELVVVSEKGLDHGSLVSFVHACRLLGHHIDFRVIKEWPSAFWHRYDLEYSLTDYFEHDDFS
jgi:hypothetical protein